MGLTWPRRYPHGVTVYKPKPAAARQQYRVVWTGLDGTRRNLWRTRLADATTAANELVRQLAAVASGEAPQQFAAVADMAAAHLVDGEHHRLWTVGYLRNTRQLLANRVLPHIGDRPCAALTAADMQATILRARQDGIDPRPLTVALRSLCSFGVRDGWLTANPMAGVTLPRHDRRTQGQAETYITPDRIPPTAAVEALAAAAAAVTGVWWRALEVRFAAYTGVRWGEQSALCTGDVDLTSNTVAVQRQVRHVAGARHVHLPKYRKVRGTFIADTLTDGLQRRLEELDGAEAPNGAPCPPGCREQAEEPHSGPLLFPAPRGGWQHASSWHKRTFRPACEQAGWPQRPDGRWQWTWHDLRHFFCTWALATPPDGLGLEVADVSLFAGHATPAFTWQAYVSTRKGAVDRAVEASRRATR